MYSLARLTRAHSFVMIILINVSSQDHLLVVTPGFNSIIQEAVGDEPGSGGAGGTTATSGGSFGGRSAGAAAGQEVAPSVFLSDKTVGNAIKHGFRVSSVRCVGAV